MGRPREWSASLNRSCNPCRARGLLQSTFGIRKSVFHPLSLQILIPRQAGLVDHTFCKLDLEFKTWTGSSSARRPLEISTHREPTLRTAHTIQLVWIIRYFPVGSLAQLRTAPVRRRALFGPAVLLCPAAHKPKLFGIQRRRVHHLMVRETALFPPSPPAHPTPHTAICKETRLNRFPAQFPLESNRSGCNSRLLTTNSFYL